MTIDECFECKEKCTKKVDMGEHGYLTYCKNCDLSTYHKYLPAIPFNYALMKSASMKIEETYGFNEGDANE